MEPKRNNSKALGDLKLTFEGTRDEQFIVISREELQQFQLGKNVCNIDYNKLNIILGLPISYVTTAPEEILGEL